VNRKRPLTIVICQSCQSRGRSRVATGQELEQTPEGPTVTAVVSGWFLHLCASTGWDPCNLTGTLTLALTVALRRNETKHSWETLFVANYPRLHPPAMFSRAQEEL
jgi:hypothetical protein